MVADGVPAAAPHEGTETVQAPPAGAEIPPAPFEGTQAPPMPPLDDDEGEEAPPEPERNSVMYSCLRCNTPTPGEELDRLPEIKCICGFRVFIKNRPPVVKTIKAV